MTHRPPRAPERFVAFAFRENESGPAILGDLHEDFQERVTDRGEFLGRLWYWTEATLLGAGELARRATTRRSNGEPLPGHLMIRSVLQDAVYAAKAMRRDPLLVLFATVIVGLGVGASTAVYSVASPLLLRPLPFPDAEQLVWIENESGGTSGMSAVTSRTSNLRDFRTNSRSFEGLAGYNAFFDQSSYNLAGEGGPPERLIGVGVTDNFLDVLGVEPALGRNFTEEEGTWGGPAAIILTHGFWVRHYGSDPSVIRRSVSLDGFPREVVGVLPPDFDFSSSFSPSTRVDFLTTFAVSDETDLGGNTLFMVGRLIPGATLETAQADLTSVLEGLAEADPERWGLGAVVSGLQERMARPFRSPLLLLAAAAASVLLIVCVNLSNLLLAKAPRRAKEMAIRTALGATRARLARQLMLESLLISIGGCLVGAAVAYGATVWVSQADGIDIPMLSAVSLDSSALIFALLAATAVGVVVGLTPALHVSGVGVAAAMGVSTRGATTSRRATRLREWLVVTEVALACVLLAFGGLLLRSFNSVLDVELGFQSEAAYAWQLSTSRELQSLEEATAHYDQVVARVAEIPGVEAVGLTDALPLGINRTWSAAVPGETYEDGLNPSIFPHVVDWNYIEAMRIPLVAGRLLTPDDNLNSEQVVVINEAASRVLFRGQDPIGRTISSVSDWRVVGIVGDVRHNALEEGAGAEVYFPYTQNPAFNKLEMVVRSTLPQTVLGEQVAAAIAAVDPTMPNRDFAPLGRLVEQASSPRRFTLTLLITFAATALLLAALGIYGVLSYTVTERLHEIGIRMALGESAHDVKRRIVGRTLFLAAIGIGIGTIVVLAGGRLIGHMLYGVGSADPLTLVTIVAVLFAAAAAAGWIPAQRAARADASSALRAA